MPRKAPPGAPVLRRSVGQISSGSAIFVYCEGETERAFLEAFRAKLRISRRLVQTWSVGDPKACVREAADKIRTEKKNGSEVWVAFDRDEHVHWAAAIDRARRLGIGLAISNPCFEIWAILLHVDHRASLSRHEAQRRLKELHAGYDHAKNPYLDVKVACPLVEIAGARCAELRRVASENGDEIGNPTSRFYELLVAIRTRVEAQTDDDSTEERSAKGTN